MSRVLPLIVVLILVVIIVRAVSARRRAQGRKERLAAFARQHGWEYDAMKNRNLRQQFSEIALFRQGADRYGENAIYGQRDGREVMMFDYHYESDAGIGKGPRTLHHYCGVVAMRAASPLKPLVIRPKGMWDKLTTAFGWGDIDFESPEFSRRYHVSGPDPQWAHEVINPRTMELLMRQEKATICMTATHILVTQSGRLEPEGMMSAIALCSGVLQGIPEQARI